MSARSLLTLEEARARAALVSDLHYEVELDLTSPEGSTYRSVTTVRFRCAEEGAGTFLDLLAPSVEAIELNGRPLSLDAFDGARVRVEGLAAENTLRVVAACSYERTCVGMQRFRDPVDGRVYCYTNFEPFNAHRVFACFDQPDVKGTFAFTVRAPRDWLVVANTAPSGPPDPDGDALRWRFPPSPPIAPYVAAVAAGPWHRVQDRHDGIELGLYCRQSLARYLDPEEIFEITKQGLDFYERAFGYPYPFGSKYDQLLVPEFSAGAMENAACVTFSESFLFRSRVTDAAREQRAEVILHEMAHMWFGNLVTMRWWNDLWLNESFATFMSVYAQVAATRFRNAWVTFNQRFKAWAYEQDQLPTTHPIVPEVPDTDSVRANFDGITYAKGASVLRQLMAWVGEESFFKGLRLYFRRHEWGNTELGDFLAALEEASGRDLGSWAGAWLETAGLNTLRLTCPAAGGRLGTPVITQTAPERWPTLRPHRVTVGLYGRPEGAGSGLELRQRLELDVVGESTEVPGLAGLPVPELVLLDDADLAYAKVRLDEPLFGALRARLGEVRDPLARQVAWGVCWDMVRDGELPARAYLEVVLRHGRMEPEVSTLQRSLDRACRALDRFGDPANRGPARERLAAFCLDALRDAAAGSDHQLAFARALVASAHSAEQLELVRGLLDGSVAFDGLAVDTDLRWEIVRALAAAGAASEPLIAAELERDPTDAGERHAAAARASQPHAAAKARAWEAATTSLDVSIPMLVSLAAGFQQGGQEDLLRPYVERYFATVASVWEERDLEFALDFARLFYPHMVIDESVVASTDAYLAEHPPPAPLRRVLLEGRDGILRALNARATDRAAAQNGEAG